MTLLIILKHFLTLNKMSEIIESGRNHKIYLTTIRKFFHLLICLVYLLGFTYDRYLLFLCSYGMLILLILVEVKKFNYY